MSTTTTAFDRSAPRYDVMTSLNPGYHTELRRLSEALVGRLGDGGGTPLNLADLACGTGLSTRALVDAAPDGSRVLGLDASPGMLAQARSKRWPIGVRFATAVAGSLDAAALGAGRFDGVQAAYLFRNVPAEARDRAVTEVFELLRPGGWLAVQEYSVAGDPRARAVWEAVSRGVIIPLGTVVDRHPSLYRYLRRSVLEFDSVDAFADRLVAAGFVDVAHRTAAGWQRGVLHTFVARKPVDS